MQMSYVNPVEMSIVGVGECITMASFNPHDYIKLSEDGFAECFNPVPDAGLSAITINTHLLGEALRNFELSIKRMVLAKLVSPKFGEVILTATRISDSEVA
jgi:hypothetical protein